MARVYRAYDHRLRRWRAIKMLLPEYAAKSSVRRRFEAEAQALARLEHPNVVRIYDVGDKGSESYILMELCEGGAVEDWLVEHGRMPARLAVDVMLSAIEGVHAAHEAGIIHRDLKPGNLLIDRRGRVKVTDFGIARTESVSTTRTNSAMGTYGYMAPEQTANAKAVDIRTDVYSLGATLFTLVTGNTEPHLFTIDREPARLDAVPEVLRPIVARAVAFSADDRYPDMPSFGQALMGVRAHLPEMDESTPPLTWRRVPEIEPPPEPLNRDSLTPQPAPMASQSARATVPDTLPADDEPSSGLVQFELPEHAPDPFLAMTPGVVGRVGHPSTTGGSTRRRFDDLYVTDESPKEEDDRFVGTMVGWKPKERERSQLDRAVFVADPSGHSTHAVAPSLALDPSAHVAHASEPKLATHAVGQFRQSERSSRARVPGAHFEQAARALPVTSPLPHAVQFASPPALAHFAGQLLHVSWPTASWNVPTSHDAHTRRPHTKVLPTPGLAHSWLSTPFGHSALFPFAD